MIDFQKYSAYGYILVGFLMILIFGGQLLLQVIGIAAGIMLVWKGFGQLMPNYRFDPFCNIRFR